MKDKIEKIHKETCENNLKKASFLQGNENKKKLSKILEKCQCIQIVNLLKSI